MSLFAGKSTCIMIVMANYQWFNQWKESKVKKRGEVYEQYKAALTQRMLDRFGRIFPHLASKASCITFMHLANSNSLFSWKQMLVASFGAGS